MTSYRKELGVFGPTFLNPLIPKILQITPVNTYGRSTLNRLTVESLVPSSDYTPNLLTFTSLTKDGSYKFPRTDFHRCPKKNKLNQNKSCYSPSISMYRNISLERTKRWFQYNIGFSDINKRGNRLLICK